MKTLTKVLNSTFIIFTFISLNADNRIVLYLQQPPKKVLTEIEMELAKEKGLNKIEKLDKKTPFEISKKLLKNEIKKDLIPKLSGFIALYSGYIDYSNLDGQISFPLRHIKPKLYLAITPRIKLIKPKGDTISHLEFYRDPRILTEIYVFEKKQDKNKQFFWEVTKQTEIPKNDRINPLSVVLLTKPKNIYVALGDFMSNDSKHIIIPNNVYVVGNIDNTKILLNTIAVKRYFEPIEYNEEKISDVVYRKMISNM